MAFFSQLKKVITLLALLICLSQSLDAQEPALYVTQPRRVTAWTDLLFEGSKFLAKIKLRMQLDSTNCKSEDFPRGGRTESFICSGAADDNMLMSISSSAEGPGLSGNKYEEDIVFNNKTFQPYSRTLKNNINGKWVKIYYWEETGVHRQKIFPANSQQNQQPPGTWTNRKLSFYRFPKEIDECSTISDPLLLLYILSTLDSYVQQKPFKICVFGKGQVHQLTIRQEQPSVLEVSYTQYSHSYAQKSEVKEQKTTFVFSIDVKTFAQDDEKKEQFSFFGLNDDIRIYIDPKKRFPLRISGKNDIIGELTLNLTEVTENTSALEAR